MSAHQCIQALYRYGLGEIDSDELVSIVSEYLNLDNPGTDQIEAITAFELEQFATQAPDQLAHLMPHLQRVRRLIQAEHQAQQLDRHLPGVLDALPVGVIVLNQKQQVVYQNRPALSLLADHPLLELHSEQGFRFRQTHDSQHWETLAFPIADSTTPIKGQVLCDSEIILSLGKDMDSLQAQAPTCWLTVSRLSEELSDDRDTWYWVLIQTPQLLQKIPPDYLQLWFGLSQKEAMVAAYVAQGMETEAISQAMGTQSTVTRNRVNQVLKKIGANNRSHLIRLLSSSLVPSDLRASCLQANRNKTSLTAIAGG